MIEHRFKIGEWIIEENKNRNSKSILSSLIKRELPKALHISEIENVYEDNFYKFRNSITLRGVIGVDNNYRYATEIEIKKSKIKDIFN